MTRSLVRHTVGVPLSLQVDQLPGCSGLLPHPPPDLLPLPLGGVVCEVLTDGGLVRVTLALVPRLFSCPVQECLQKSAVPYGCSEGLLRLQGLSLGMGLVSSL